MSDAQAAASSREEVKKTTAYLYLIAIVFMFSVWGFCRYKLQTIIPTLTKLMNIEMGAAGSLLSIMNLCGLFITIPFGVVMGKIGPKKTAVIGMLLVICGSFFGTFNTTNFSLLMVSQFIVGSGGSIISIIGPHMIGIIFPSKQRATANGVYITAGTICQMVMYNLVPRITTAEDVAPAWWFTNIFGIVVLLAWWFIIKDKIASGAGFKTSKDISSGEKTDSPSQAKKPSMLEAFKNPGVLQLAIGGCFMMFSAFCILSFSPAYLVVERGYTQAAAGSLVSGAALIGTFSTLFGGLLSDILKTRKWVYFAAISWMVVSRILLPIVPDGILVNLIIWGQGLPSVTMGLIYSCIPDVTRDPSENAVATATVATGIRIGSFFSGMVFGFIVQFSGYRIAFWILALLSVLAYSGVATVKKIK
jgi:nitrate/nitrite transporter NarK